MGLLSSSEHITRVEGNLHAYPLHALIEIILDHHHTYLKHELPVLEEVVEQNTRLDPDFCRTTACELLPIFLRLRKELEAHIMREEIVLFPLIERLELAIAEDRPAPRNSFGPLSNAIKFMNEDHGFEDRLFGTMAGITNGFACPPGASDSYASLMDRLKAMKLDLDEHIRKEDEMLFPKALSLEEGGQQDE